ncbi:MAG TPA: thioesterase domain-containing protein [Bryobacteraceae bacterium]|nr:thioesterase domain-containing protein [Bryobacteraceae bacterium]
MRILLAQNSLYYPAHGGGDKSNRLLLEALAARGHECRAVARTAAFGEPEQRRYLAELESRGVHPQLTAEGVVRFNRAGAEVHISTLWHPRACFHALAQTFRPDAVLVSTDDPAQILLEAALAIENTRVVYLARATLALPFGPDAAFVSDAKTARLCASSRVVGVSRYVADYIRRHAFIDAVHVPISLIEHEDWADLGRFENEFVTMVNPCAVKGIDVFLALADTFPALRFAVVPTWGTNARDRAALQARANISMLDPVDDINLLLARTRVLLVPSVWAEARSRIVLEATLRGVPVMAANIGGIPEAKMGVPYLLPVAPIARYRPEVDERMVPVAEVPPQDIGPWRDALARLTTDPAHYREIARASRAAALAYARELTVEPFERVLQDAPIRQPTPRGQTSAGHLSPEKRKLLAIRLRQKAPAAAWFPGVETVTGPCVFSFPHAGGGAPAWGGSFFVPVRLPGRESRLAEAPFERMQPLIAALASAIEGYLDRPFAFFGHSMGAVVAFELARELRRRRRPVPGMLIASGARAPRYRLGHIPPPDPSDEQLLADLRRLSGTPAELLEDRAGLRAVLPALRADAALYRYYVYRPEPPLDAPIRAYGGLDDPNVTREHLEAWAGETTASFAVRRFPGGHFYWQGHREELLAAIEQDLEAAW